jgi:ATP-dependent Lon protease
MANGNFTRSTTVTANASMAFVGNIDDSIDSIVNSPAQTLFKPLHPVFDLAILDRFHTFVPGWEIPVNKDENLTRHYGFIIEYLAEAFHHMARKTNRFAQVKAACKLGPGFSQRDQTGVLKTVCAFVKILHPGDEPTQAEIEEYLAYAIEGRRRVKEQMNKRKPDEEFASINLGYLDDNGELQVVFCPESKDAPATQHPVRKQSGPQGGGASQPPVVADAVAVPAAKPPKQPAKTIAQPVLPEEPVEVENAPVSVPVEQEAPKERHYRIHYGATGYSYETIFGEYVAGAEEIVVEDPYIRHHHQVVNFVRFCEMAVRFGPPKKMILVTKFDTPEEEVEAMTKLATLAESLKIYGVTLLIKKNPSMHDREVRFSNGWKVKIGRGFDIYQKPEDWLAIGANDLDLRPCLETNVDVIRELG